jgi:hypothetical protein
MSAEERQKGKGSAGIEFICPTCGGSLPRDLARIIPHTEAHIVEAIRKKHPRWVGEDGTCEKCYTYYKEQMAGK